MHLPIRLIRPIGTAVMAVLLVGSAAFATSSFIGGRTAAEARPAAAESTATDGAGSRLEGAAAPPSVRATPDGREQAEATGSHGPDETAEPDETGEPAAEDDHRHDAAGGDGGHEGSGDGAAPAATDDHDDQDDHGGDHDDDDHGGSDEHDDAGHGGGDHEDD